MGNLMSIHIAQVNELGFSPADFALAKERENTIRRMAHDLVAETGCGLDLSSEPDVALFLFDRASEKYGWKNIRAHTDAAVYLARETIAAAAEGLR